MEESAEQVALPRAATTPAALGDPTATSLRASNLPAGMEIAIWATVFGESVALALNLRLPKGLCRDADWIHRLAHVGCRIGVQQ